MENMYQKLVETFKNECVRLEITEPKDIDNAVLGWIYRKYKGRYPNARIKEVSKQIAEDVNKSINN